MAVARITSPVLARPRKATPRSASLVMEAPECFVENDSGSPARGIVIALLLSSGIWAGIAALVF